MSEGHRGLSSLNDPDGRKAVVWVVNLERHFQQILLDIPPGMTLVTYKHCCEMPGVSLGQPANLGLLGSESGIWTIESPEAIDPKALLERLRTGVSR
jgi:hypothetical protein